MAGALSAHVHRLVGTVLETRRRTVRLAEPLAPEDAAAQSMPDASPAKWHLAHTSWFFERFVLAPLGVAPHRADADYLWNSYYDTVGARHPRAKRGLLTRPSLEEVLAYRRAVDARLEAFAGERHIDDEVAAALELGINHEEQHQELLLTDVKHLFAQSPLLPAYAEPKARDHAATKAPELAWIANPGGLVEIGASSAADFSFDNERPRHKTYCRPFSLASRTVTCGEYQAFIADGGYGRPELWLSEGWSWVKDTASAAPLYWLAGRELFTLRGKRPLIEDEPVCHVSYYEAEAYARWARARLPTEAEWELTAVQQSGSEHGAFADDRRFHPSPAGRMLGDVWEWTSSAYAPYPGFRALEGAFGEYNGKFMSSQMVLRGGSCATPVRHIRPTYRNFFPPAAQWQFSGIRLARDDA